MVYVLYRFQNYLTCFIIIHYIKKKIYNLKLFYNVLYFFK